MEQALDIAITCLGPGYPIPPRAQYLLDEILESGDTPSRMAPGSSPSPSKPQRSQTLDPPSRFDGPYLA